MKSIYYKKSLVSPLIALLTFFVIFNSNANQCAVYFEELGYKSLDNAQLTSIISSEKPTSIIRSFMINGTTQVQLGFERTVIRFRGLEFPRSRILLIASFGEGQKIRDLNQLQDFMVTIDSGLFYKIGIPAGLKELDGNIGSRDHQFYAKGLSSIVNDSNSTATITILETLTGLIQDHLPGAITKDLVSAEN